MRRLPGVMLAATTVLAVTVLPAASRAASAEDGPRDLRMRLDQVVDTAAVGALAEVRDGRRVWVGTSGVAEAGTSKAVPARGRFRIGSITKTFVATVVLQLADQGRLRLDDPVEVYLPGVVPDGHRVTVRHLLDHTSGLYDYLRTLPMPGQPEFYDNRWRTWTDEELVARAFAHPPTFEPPGSAFAYSNTNYALLGMIIERVTGRSYGEEIEDRIIRPLRLTGTSVPGTSPEIPGPHPHGYVPTFQDGGMRLLDYTEMNPSVMGASGEMISRTKDLDRFFEALLGGRLLSAHLLEQMKTPGVEGGRQYGLGLAWRDTSCGIRVYGNDGDALAYQAWSFATADLRRQVTVGVTPDFRRNPDAAVDAFVDAAICG